MPTGPSGLGWEQKQALIIGRASPEPSKKHIETVCTGAITEQGQLLRLYPIPLRYLQDTQKYSLWTWAKFEVQKNPHDKRKESYRVRPDAISILSRVQSNSEKFSLLKKAIAQDRETLEAQYRKDWTSMGVVEVRLVDLKPQIQKGNWEKDKPYIKQFELFVERKPLEQLPIEIRLRYRCANNPNCKTHVSSLIGWEYMEAFRKFRSKYHSGLEAFAKIKEELGRRFSDATRSSFALLGTHSRYPSWMVAQIYFFDKSLPSRLF
jgi:hypothetical protein